METDRSLRRRARDSTLPRAYKPERPQTTKDKENENVAMMAAHATCTMNGSPSATWPTASTTAACAGAAATTDAATDATDAKATCKSSKKHPVSLLHHCITRKLSAYTPRTPSANPRAAVVSELIQQPERSSARYPPRTRAARPRTRPHPDPLGAQPFTALQRAVKPPRTPSERARNPDQRPTRARAAIDEGSSVCPDGSTIISRARHRARFPPIARPRKRRVHLRRIARPTARASHLANDDARARAPSPDRAPRWGRRRCAHAPFPRSCSP